MSQSGWSIEFGSRWLLSFILLLPVSGYGQRSFSAN